MSKHTPGPWVSDGTQIFDDRHRDPVATCLYRDFDVSARNANLIASAPDLLEALEKFMAHGEQAFGHDFEIMIKARTAIAKARGEA